MTMPREQLVGERSFGSLPMIAWVWVESASLGVLSAAATCRAIGPSFGFYFLFFAHILDFLNDFFLGFF